MSPKNIFQSRRFNFVTARLNAESPTAFVWLPHASVIGLVNSPLNNVRPS